MKLSISVAGAGSYTELGNESDRSAVLEVSSLSVAPQVQVEPLVRSSTPFIENRDNEATAVGFVITKQYADRDTSLAAVLTYSAYADGKWDLKLEEGATVIYFPGASLTAYEPAFTGLAISHQTQWVSEPMTSSAP